MTAATYTHLNLKCPLSPCHFHKSNTLCQQLALRFICSSCVCCASTLRPFYAKKKSLPSPASAPLVHLWAEQKNFQIIYVCCNSLPFHFLITFFHSIFLSLAGCNSLVCCDCPFIVVSSCVVFMFMFSLCNDTTQLLPYFQLGCVRFRAFVLVVVGHGRRWCRSHFRFIHQAIHTAHRKRNLKQTEERNFNKNTNFRLLQQQKIPSKPQWQCVRS